jgi:hypothetical protein
MLIGVIDQIEQHIDELSVRIPVMSIRDSA